MDSYLIQVINRVNSKIDIYIDCGTGDRYQNPLDQKDNYTGTGSTFKNDTGVYMKGYFQDGEFKHGIIL